LEYGGDDPLKCNGPYNYGSDIWTSVQSCQAAQPAASSGPAQPGVHPAAPAVDPARLKESLISQFGITMDGFDNAHLQWAWEKFWEVSNTNFTRFIRGSVIQITDPRRSEQKGCPGRDPVTVLLGQYDQALFKYILTHELGHTIQHCTGSNSFSAEHLNAYNREGGVTYYANHAASQSCSHGTANNVNEDYAEMIALYLNPSANVRAVNCDTTGRYTNLRVEFPLHYNVARSILGDY